VTFPPDAPALARDFVLACLQTTPALRPSIDQLRRHPWVLEGAFSPAK